VQHVSAFITLCEGYLGVPPVFELWRYFLAASLIQSKVNGVPTSHPVGYASIHLCSGGDRCSQQYIEMGRLKASNKGWHTSWFYIKNEEAATLPRFAGRLVEEAPTS
jgi:hypothetical protein